ncbi:MAG: PEGA domain-containing protein [Myxococcota bacterium]
MLNTYRTTTLVALLLLLSFPAAAQEEAPSEQAPAEATQPDDAADALTPEQIASKERAEELSAEATELFQKELYNSAVELFIKAYQADPQLVFIYNIAVCYERLGDSDNCVDYYEKYLTQFGVENDGAAPEDLVDVRNTIAKCRLGAKVQITIESDPPGASVAIDQRGTIVGQTPLSLRQDAGTYTFYVDLPEHQPIERKVEVRTGEPVRLLFTMEKVVRTGTITVRANITGATIFVDGRNIGLTPYNDPIRVDEGTHQLILKKEDYTIYSEETYIAAGDAQTLTAELWLRDPPTTWKGYVGWTALGLGAGLVTGGFFMGQEASKHYAESSQIPLGLLDVPLSETTYEPSSEFGQFQLLEQVGYWTGGVMMGLGLSLVILEAFDVYMIKKEDAPFENIDSDSVEILPIFSPTRGGGFAGARVTF